MISHLGIGREAAADWEINVMSEASTAELNMWLASHNWIQALSWPYQTSNQGDNTEKRAFAVVPWAEKYAPAQGGGVGFVSLGDGA
jgi:hypothetical protein